jgi:hypothetical protein
MQSILQYRQENLKSRNKTVRTTFAKRAAAVKRVKFLANRLVRRGRKPLDARGLARTIVASEQAA